MEKTRLGRFRVEKNVLTRSNTVGLVVVTFFKNVCHILNVRSLSDVYGPQAMYIEKGALANPGSGFRLDILRNIDGLRGGIFELF